MGVRRLLTLVRGLPLDAALHREVATKAEQWTTAHELAAQTVEVTHALYAAFVAANSKKGARRPKALRIPRPGSESAGNAERPRASLADVARRMMGAGR